MHEKIREFSRREDDFFCSQLLYYISSICSRALWLDEAGHELWTVAEVVHEYETFLRERDREKPAIVAAGSRDRRPPFREIVVCDAPAFPAIALPAAKTSLRLRIESDVPKQPRTCWWDPSRSGRPAVLHGRHPCDGCTAFPATGMR